MKVAVDFQSAQGRRTGLGVYTENLVSAMQEAAPQDEFLLYKTGSDRDLGTVERIIWESFTIPVRTLGDRPHVVLRPAFAPAIWSLTPQVVTVHDLIGRIFPQNLPPPARFYWSTWLPFCVRRARAVLADSECTRRDIERFLGIPASKVRVVLLAPGQAFYPEDRAMALEAVRRRFNLNSPYFITVGTLEPRKNIPRLLRAFALFLKKNPGGARLALAGKSGGQETELKRLTEELGLTKDVLFLGYVTDDELRRLYNGAIGYAFVSLYEGFGLPVLEAMACGVSGVCSNASSLPEVAGDTAVYADPESIEDIADKLERYYAGGGLRGRLGAAALERARGFSWKRAAGEALQVLRENASKC